MFQKIAKHRANDASNDVHRPPLCPPEAQERAGKKLLYVMFHVFILRHTVIDHILEHKTCDILAAERLRLMGFDNRLIIDCFANVVSLPIW